MIFPATAIIGVDADSLVLGVLSNLVLIRRHEKMLPVQTGGIDYRKVVVQRQWSFHEFAKTVAQLIGKKAGLADLIAG